MRRICPHDAAHSTPPHLVEQALAVAEAWCVAAGERWTAPRQRTYELLIEAGKPVKAYDLIHAFSRDRKLAKPTTIYRSLEFLGALGLVHRVECLNSYVACSGAPEPHLAQFLICDCCGSTTELDLGIAEVACAEAHRHGFDATSVLLELRGCCRACQ